MAGKRATNRVLPRWAVWIIAALVVILSALFLFEVLTRASRRRWQAYAASIRASGQPLTFAEIEAARPKIPDEQNGALVIERIAEDLDEIYKSRDEVDEWVFHFGTRDEGHDFLSGVAVERIEPSRKFLADNQDVMNALAELRDRPAGRIDLPETDDYIEYMLPGLSSTRTAARLFAVRFSLELVDGNSEAAAEDLRLYTHATATFNYQPSLIAVLVQDALDGLLVEQIEAFFSVFHSFTNELNLLHQIVSKRLESPAIHWALLGERAFLVALFDDYTNLGTNIGGSLNPSFASKLPFMPELLARENQIRAVELVTKLIDAGDDGIAQLSVTRQMANELASLSIFYRLTQETNTSVLRSIEFYYRIQGQLRSALTAIAAERFRLDHGRFPETLDELVPEYLDEVPIDPFDGKPIKMKETDLGIVIYTIGDDEVDNDGQVEFGENRRPLDFGIRLLRPEHRGLKLIRVTEDAAPEAQTP